MASDEKQTVAITADLRDRIPWFKSAVEETMLAAVEKERQARMTPIIHSALVAARSYARRIRWIRRKQKLADNDKVRLFLLWAQKKVERIADVTIRPAVSLQLDEGAVIAGLDSIEGLRAESRAKLVETRQHLKLDELLLEAKTNEGLRKLILGNVEATATLSANVPPEEKK
jgi:hypothetical protein